MDQLGHEASPMVVWFQKDANFSVTNAATRGTGGVAVERYV